MCDSAGETRTMDFGDILKALKQGQRAARLGWNGNGIFVSLKANPHDDTSIVSFPYLYINTYHLQTSNPNAPKGIVPWLPSQTDILATDWILVS